MTRALYINLGWPRPATSRFGKNFFKRTVGKVWVRIMKIYKCFTYVDVWDATSEGLHHNLGILNSKHLCSENKPQYPLVLKKCFMGFSCTKGTFSSDNNIWQVLWGNYYNDNKIPLLSSLVLISLHSSMEASFLNADFFLGMCPEEDLWLEYMWISIQDLPLFIIKIKEAIWHFKKKKRKREDI